MSALGQNRPLRPGKPKDRFAPKAVIPDIGHLRPSPRCALALLGTGTF